MRPPAAAPAPPSTPTGCAQLAGPHAASQLGSNTYCYDANGNQTSANFGGGQTRTISYTGYDLPAQITTNGTPSVATESFSYAPDRSMFKRVEGLNGPSDRIFCNGFETTPCPSGNAPRSYYIGNVEVRMVGTTTTTKRYIGSYLVITTITTGASTTNPTFAYLLRDVLGSIDVIVSETATVIQHQGFDAWGNRRDASPGGQWTILPPASAAAFDTTTTYQGFTGHQQLDPVGLIHMRGRLYDPQLGRFIQADPMTEADATQGLNRYTYVQNNPLSMTDPSGYISFRQIVGIAIAVVAAFLTAGASTPLIGLAYATAGGFLSTYVATGSLKAGLWGAFAAGIFFGIGSYFQNASWAHDTEFGCSQGLNTGATVAKVAAHAAAGGVLNELQGGNFGSGFLAAGVTEALSPAVEKLPGVARPFAAALVGGTVSKAAGGSFANGAETALFQELFNHVAHYSSSDGDGNVPSATAKQARVIAPDGSDFVGPLSSEQQADVNAINTTLSMLAVTVNASMNTMAILRYNETTFEYEPGWNDGSVAETGTVNLDAPITKFGTGFAQYLRGGDANAHSYNYYFFNSGPTMALFLSAHELGHSIVGQDEFAASNFANHLIQSYPSVDNHSYRCYESCQ